MKALETQVNLTLLNDVISFVVQTVDASRPQKRQLEQRCMFPIALMNANPFQERYGFMYLGELLERYEERFGVSAPDRRAIALALGYTRDIATKEMFVGSQRADFIQAVEWAAQGDIYLTGALYLLNEGEADGPAYEKQLKEWQYAETEELLFAMSLFDDIEQAVTQFKAQLVLLLGSNRTMPVLENTAILGWLVAKLHPMKKLLKAKEFAAIRALLALPTSFVRPDSKPHDCLVVYGYTPLEIAYANLLAVCNRWLSNGLNPFGLSAEKIAVNLFRTVLAQEDSLPAAVYAQLTQLYPKYANFEVKYLESRRLADTLKAGAHIQNAETMAWFIKTESVYHPAVDSFDVLEPKWDALTTSLRDDDYRCLFENSLSDTMSGAELKDRIARYDALTGGSYLDCYRKDDNGRCFSLLVGKGLIDLWTEFQNALLGKNTSSGGMISRIGDYVKGITTPQAFQFLRKFMPQYGYAGLKKFFFGFGNGFDNQLWEEHSYSGVTVSLLLKRDFLADDPAGQLLLLHWADEYFFTIKPSHYLAFIQAVLNDDHAGGLLPREKLRRLFDLLLTQSELSSQDANRLKQRYFTSEELQADEKAKDAEEQAEKRRRQDERNTEIREKYARMADGTFQSVWKFTDSYRYNDSEMAVAAQIVREGLDSQMTAIGCVLPQKDVPYFLHVCARLLEHGAMDWAEAQSYISKIKEVIDDAQSSGTAA